MEGNVPLKSLPRTVPLTKFCEVCGCRFATRQGLSSHARLHLRNLGVPLSECTNGPIALLSKLKECKGSSLDLTLDPKNVMDLSDHEVKSQKFEKIPSTKNTLMGSPSGLKRDTPSPLVSPHKTGESSKNDAPQCSSSKRAILNPLWAPQETDAPLTLVSNSNDEVHVCQVCGAWYETRKGLSSHARAHLRQLGVSDASSKMSPIALLYKLKKIQPEVRRLVTPQTSTKSSGKHPLDSPSTSSLAAPPGKRAKVLKKFVCVLCGEEFENRKGLGSHARSHLRQIGIAGLLGKSSAVDAIEELARSGMLADMWPMTGDKTASPSAAKAKAQLSSPSTPPHPPQSFSPNTTALSSSGHPPHVNKTPKAKKGFRLAVDPQWKKPKKEPQDTEMPASVNFIEPTFDGQPIPLILCEYCGQLFDCRKGLSCHVRAHLRQLGITWTSKSSPIDLLRELMGKEGSGMDLSSGRKGSSQNPSYCDLCGFEFQHRKALASHARAHLRQLGVTEWKTDGTKGSPIEILNEWIRKEPAKVAEITQRYLMGDLYIKKKANPSPAPPMEDAPGTPGSPEPLGLLLPGPRAGRELLGSPVESPKVARELSHVERGHIHKHLAFGDVKVPSSSRIRPQKQQLPSGQENVDGSPQQQNPRPGNIPALLPNPPLTPLVKLVGKVYSLKCRFCDQVFQGPLSVQEDWIAHLQKHILKLGYKGKASPSPALAMTPQSMVDLAAT